MEPASRLIDQRILDLGGWRGETLARMRALILQADPEMTEEWKWMGTPIWSHHGIVCTREGRGGPEWRADEETVDPEEALMSHEIMNLGVEPPSS